jgi:hypothetical protein
MLRSKAADPSFADARRALDATAAAYHASLPALPEQQAGYYHDFFCPRHAVQLVFDPQGPHHHACPVDGEVFSGEPFDSAWRWSVNDVLSDAALKLALHAALLGDRVDDGGAADDRRRAAEILLGYAERYRQMPPAPRVHPNHPGVVTWSGLDESVWVIRLAWAHALLEQMPSDWHRKIRNDLLRPAADHLSRVRWPEIHNVTSWNNAALATMAIALDDAPLLAAALDEPLGLLAQLARGVRGEGLWWEGSLSYHYYALAAVIWTVRALRASGRPAPGDEVLRGMFRAPLAIAFPDLTLPAIHDCWYQIALTGEVGHGIPNAAGFYEVAYGWYAELDFAWVLRKNYARRTRSSIEALLDGAPTIPDVTTPIRASYYARESGLAVLRTGPSGDDPSYLMLKAGPTARDHGHPDQLSIQLFASGVRMTPDLGTPGYGIDLNETWYRQTASHSTVLLDGRSQPLASGRIDHFRAGNVAVAAGSVAWVDGDYAGVSMRRILFGRDDYFVDLFRVDCPAPRQIDWLYHHLGQLVEGRPTTLATGTLVGDCGYAHVTDVGRLDRSGTMGLRWQVGKAWLDLYLPADAEEEMFVGAAPANPASETLSLLVRRRVASQAVFLAVFAPSRRERDSIVHGVRWLRSDELPYRLVIETSHGAERWEIGPEPTAFRLDRPQ